MIQTNTNLYFEQSDFERFKEWVALDIESLTWQGKFREDFDKFWTIFFVDGLSLRQLVDRFQYAYHKCEIGPLQAWFKWLFEKFLCYAFIHRELKVEFLARESGMSVGEISAILRNFFNEAFPGFDDEFSHLFQITHLASDGLQLDYQTLRQRLNLPAVINGSHEDDVMPVMEVTLYEEWGIFIRRMEADFFHPEFDFKRIKINASLTKQIKFAKEVTVLLVVGVALVYAIQQGNKIYEDYLVDKISVYEPQFKWLDRTLSFKSVDPKEVKNVDLEVDDIDKVDQEGVQFPSFEEEERFDTESEVQLSSLDSIPRDFNAADLETSGYEEERRTGYRDSSYGNTTVFRVMLKSEDTISSRQKLNQLLDVYGVTQVDNVRPGTPVPGGIYYNIFVPRNHLKEFLAQVMEIDEAVLYESRTRARGNPPGKNKVFIWVKSLN